MTIAVPAPLDFNRWDEMSDPDREFFWFDEDDLPLPITHQQQISHFSRESANKLSEWLGSSMPKGWSADALPFPHVVLFRLNDSHWNTESGKSEVRKWLHYRSIPYSANIYLFYSSDCVISIPWKLLVKYWYAFAGPDCYAMVATDKTAHWACSFHHENVIIFGAYDRKKTDRHGQPLSQG